MAQISTKVASRSAYLVVGEQCVMTRGGLMMPEWSANSLDIKSKVSNYIQITHTFKACDIRKRDCGFGFYVISVSVAYIPLRCSSIL